MARGGCDFRQFREFQEKLQKLEQADFEAFCEASAKELAARLLAKVKYRTKPGEYPPSTGKVGGTLRSGWTVGAMEKRGNMYCIEVINPIFYASYVEFGHRTRNHKGWVKGKFMLTISEQELQSQARSILEKKLTQFLKNQFE